MPESAGKLLAALVLQFRIEGNRTRPGDACRDSEAGQSRPRTPALLVAISMHLAADGEPAAVTASSDTPPETIAGPADPAPQDFESVSRVEIEERPELRGKGALAAAGSSSGAATPPAFALAAHRGSDARAGDRPALETFGSPDQSAESSAACPPFVKTRYSALIAVADQPVDGVPGLAGGDKEGACVRGQHTSRGIKAGPRIGPRADRLRVPADAEKQGRQPDQRWYPEPDDAASLAAGEYGELAGERKALAFVRRRYQSWSGRDARDRSNPVVTPRPADASAIVGGAVVSAL